MQELPNRKTPRAQRYDYASAGAYFITICCKDHEEYFGRIVDGEMILNEIGMICDEEIQKLNERKTVDIHEWIVMPNHIHLLLCMHEQNMGKRNINGWCRDASIMRPNNRGIMRPNNDGILCGADNGEMLCGTDINGWCRDASIMRPNNRGIMRLNDEWMLYGSDGLTNRPYEWPLLGAIIKLFKWNITKYAQIHNIPFARQSRYHDHIIRNENEYNNIKRYIQNNPKKRTEDKMYIKSP